MPTLVPVAVSPLRQRLIDVMDIRRFGRETQRNYIRDGGRFATFVGRSPDTATAEDVRRFQIDRRRDPARLDSTEPCGIYACGADATCVDHRRRGRYLEPS